MAERVIQKRTSRVSFLGVSNLPHDKAIQLRDILQEIINKLSTLHGTVSDSKMQVADRCKQVMLDLSPLSALIDDLLALARLQCHICQSPPSSSSPSSSSSASVQGVQAELKSILDLIVSSCSKVSSLLQQYSAKNGFELVNELLSVVKHTVDLLRTADRYTVFRIDQMANEVFSLAKAVSEATNMAMLVERATPLSRAALDIARISEQRATALEQNNAAKDVKERLHAASAAVGSLTPQVILASKEGIGARRSADTTPLNQMKRALDDIAQATLVAPEFAVLFEVDYLDSALGLKLAALVDAVRAGDRIGAASSAKAVDKELDRRIAQAKKNPAQEATIQAARAAQAQAQSAAREALTTRLAHAEPQAGAYLVADQNMIQHITTLKQAAINLPDPSTAAINSQIPLIQAARALSLQMWSLLQS